MCLWMRKTKPTPISDGAVRVGCISVFRTDISELNISRICVRDCHNDVNGSPLNCSQLAITIVFNSRMNTNLYGCSADFASIRLSSQSALISEGTASHHKSPWARSNHLALMAL